MALPITARREMPLSKGYKERVLEKKTNHEKVGR